MPRWSEQQYRQHLAKLAVTALEEGDNTPSSREGWQYVAAEEESQLQANIETYLEENEVWFKHDEDSLKERPGLPDLIICDPIIYIDIRPRPLGSRFVVCELKVKNRKPTGDQLAEMAKVRRSGGRTFFAQSLEEFIYKFRNGINESYPQWMTQEEAIERLKKASLDQEL